MNLKWARVVPACRLLIIVICVIIIEQVSSARPCDISGSYQNGSYAYSLNGKVLTKENLNSSLLDFPVSVSAPACSNQRVAWRQAGLECPSALGVQIFNKFTDVYANLRSLNANRDEFSPGDVGAGVHYAARTAPNAIASVRLTSANLQARILQWFGGRDDFPDAKRQTALENFGVASSAITVQFGREESENSARGGRVMQYNSGREQEMERVVVEYENVGNYYYEVGGNQSAKRGKIQTAPLSARLTIDNIKAKSNQKSAQKLPKIVFSNNLRAGFYTDQIDAFNFRLEFVAKHLYGAAFTITDEDSSKANSGKILDVELNNHDLACQNNLCTINFDAYTLPGNYERPEAKRAENSGQNASELLLDMELGVVDMETGETLNNAGDFEIKKCKNAPSSAFPAQKFAQIAAHCDDVYLDFHPGEHDRLQKIKNLKVDNEYTFYILRNRKQPQNYADNSNSYYSITLHADFAARTIDPYIYYNDFTARGNFNAVESGVITENGSANEVATGESFLYDARTRKISMNVPLSKAAPNLRVNTGVDCGLQTGQNECGDDQLRIMVWKSDASGSLTNFRAGNRAGISVNMGRSSSGANLCYAPGDVRAGEIVRENISRLCQFQGVGPAQALNRAQVDSLPVGWYVLQWNRRLYLVRLSTTSARIIPSDFDGRNYIWQCGQKGADNYELDDSCGRGFSTVRDNTVEFRLP